MSFLESRPWLLAGIGAFGVTSLVAGSVALLAPPETLDQLILMGDVRLAASLAAIFFAGAGVLRVLLRRRRLLEISEDPAPVQERAVSSRAYLR